MPNLQSTYNEIMKSFEKKYSTVQSQCDCKPDKVLVGILLGDMKSFLSQSLVKVLEATREEIDGQGFASINQAGQFAQHADGYNQAIEEVKDLITKTIKEIE